MGPNGTLGSNHGIKNGGLSHRKWRDVPNALERLQPVLTLVLHEHVRNNLHDLSAVCHARRVRAEPRLVCELGAREDVFREGPKLYM